MYYSLYRFGEYLATEQVFTPAGVDQPQELSDMIMECDNARIAVKVFTRVDGDAVLLCACGTTKVPFGLLTNRLEKVHECIRSTEKVFKLAMESQQ